MTTIFEELGEYFRETARPRVREMEALVDALRRAPSDAAALDRLSRHFHALAGIGESCGFRRVSELAEEGEATSMTIARAATTPAEKHIRRWSELVLAIAREIA